MESTTTNSTEPTGAYADGIYTDTYRTAVSMSRADPSLPVWMLKRQSYRADRILYCVGNLRSEDEKFYKLVML